MDNTTFGGNIPSLPQWTGAPYGIIHVQTMLYASLAASLFSAFLAMLGKQWLNRYVLTGMRGTAIERNQDRQRKLDGIITWYFDHVMESLPLILQFALLLLGCALSLYLWGIDVTIACVVLGVTALGVILYVFAVIAGTASASCSYQTPGARILRHILYHTLPPIFGPPYPVLRGLIRNSRCLLYPRRWWDAPALFKHILRSPFHLACDAYQAMARGFVFLARWVPRWLHNTRSARARRLNQRTAVLDSQCISWILQTSLEKGIRLSTLKFLATTPTLTDFTPALVSDCFDIFIDCVKANEGGLVIIQGMEQLVEVSAMCFFFAYSHLSIMDPIPGILVGVRQRYKRIFPWNTDFSCLPFPHTLEAIHEAIYLDLEFETWIQWEYHKLTNHKHVALAHAFSKLSWSEYPRRALCRVPRQSILFASHFLPQRPLPSPSIITNCLLIIAIDLDCNVPNTMVFGDRYDRT